LLAKPIQHHRSRFNLAAGLPGELRLDQLDRGVIELDDALASGALKVVVLAGQDGVEALLAAVFVEMPGADQAFLFQPAQGAVNGGQVDRGVALTDHGEDFLGSGVAAQAIQRLQDYPSLGGHPPALGVKPVSGEIYKGIHRFINLGIAYCKKVASLLQMICNNCNAPIP
jgi:hypothetical protein